MRRESRNDLEKKLNRKSKLLNRYMILVGIYIVLAIVSVSFLFYSTHTTPAKRMQLKYDKLSEEASCDGVEIYFTNESFDRDVMSLKMTISNNCYGNHNETNYSFSRILSFHDTLGNCTPGIDCEDISFMIMCLAEEYNETCEYYTYSGYNFDSHRGVKCKKSYGWRDVN